MFKRTQTRRKEQPVSVTRKRKTKAESLKISPKHIEGWMHYDFTASEPSVNEQELTSIKALVTYLAHITNQNEFAVERQFSDRFNIPNVKYLPSERYDAAVRYLVDQVPPSFCN